MNTVPLEKAVCDVPVSREFWDQPEEYVISVLKPDAETSLNRLGELFSEIEYSVVDDPFVLREMYPEIGQVDFVLIRFSAYVARHSAA